jgi:hypothetical protein
MPDFTPHQKKIVDRYYDNRDQIMLDKLSQLVSELYLADSDKKRDQLWKRVDAAMKNLKVDQALRAHIIEKRNPEILATNLRDWVK